MTKRLLMGNLIATGRMHDGISPAEATHTLKRALREFGHHFTDGTDTKPVVMDCNDGSPCVVIIRPARPQ